MKRVIWADTATRDLADIRAYLTETYGEKVAERHIAALVLAARWLLNFPGAGAPLGIGSQRKWRPGKLRHVLIYTPVTDGIHVVRVRHQRNDWNPVPRDG